MDLDAVEEARVDEPGESSALDRVLSLVSDEEPRALESTNSHAPGAAPTGAGLRVARVIELEGAQLLVEWLDGSERVRARCAPFVDVEFAADALKEGQMALVEVGASGAWVVGFVQTQRARVTHIASSVVEIEGKEEVVLRSGRAALRLRADGTVELLGTRISALSRGVLKLVGRALRLN